MEKRSDFFKVLGLVAIIFLGTSILGAGCKEKNSKDTPKSPNMVGKNADKTGASIEKKRIKDVKLAGEDFGEGVKDAGNLTSITKIVQTPGDYDGKTVTIKGIIASVCPSAGCFFHLGEGSSQIMVDLKQNGFSIPPGKNIGHLAFATGSVSISGDQVKIIGKGVKILEKK